MFYALTADDDKERHIRLLHDISSTDSEGGLVQCNSNAVNHNVTRKTTGTEELRLPSTTLM